MQIHSRTQKTCFTLGPRYIYDIYSHLETALKATFPPCNNTMEAWNQNSWEDPCDPWIILNIMVIVINGDHTRARYVV